MTAGPQTLLQVVASRFGSGRSVLGVWLARERQRALSEAALVRAVPLVEAWVHEMPTGPLSCAEVEALAVAAVTGARDGGPGA